MEKKLEKKLSSTVYLQELFSSYIINVVTNLKSEPCPEIFFIAARNVSYLELYFQRHAFEAFIIEME